MTTTSGLLLSALGGAFIGFAALFLYWSIGKIAGIRSMIFGLFERNEQKPSQLVWRGAFLLSLILGIAVAHALFDIAIPTAPVVNNHLLVTGAVLTGVGTYLANGCTSGHGVCGIGRLSTRSITATLTFMLTGFLTATILY